MLYILFWFSRLYYMRREIASGERVTRTRPDRLRIALISSFSLPGAVVGFLSVFAPQRARWATLPTPTWSRWIGVALGVVAMPLFIWTHHALGKNWSADLVIKEEHTLITSGPYRWVRHPMYTSFFGLSLAFFLLSANWVIGLAGLATSVLGAARVDKEEALMIEEFGDEYRAYMQRTGRFLPRIRP
jgi:protein-S-isoprenylcysteine O-methyltransferase Ste14